jgi:hypothetical protein
MSTTNNERIRTLAELALRLANNDIARAIHILSELSGLSFEFAFEAVEDAAAVGEVKPE